MNNCNKTELSNFAISCSCKILYFSVLIRSLMMNCWERKRVDVAEFLCIYIYIYIYIYKLCSTDKIIGFIVLCSCSKKTFQFIFQWHTFVCYILFYYVYPSVSWRNMQLMLWFTTYVMIQACNGTALPLPLHMFPLWCPRTWQLYRKVSLHLPGHLLTAAGLSDRLEETRCG
jgi:hypothetical protein